MKKIFKLKPEKLSFRDKIIVTFLVLLIITAGFVIPLVLSQRLSGQLQQQALDFTEGEIADKNVIAKNKIQYIDYEATEAARRKAVQNVRPQFTLSLEKTLKILTLFDDFKTSLLANDIEKVPESVFTLFSTAAVDLHAVYSNLQSFSVQDKLRLIHIAEKKLKSIFENGVFSESEIQEIKSLHQNEVEIRLFNDEFTGELVRIEKIDTLIDVTEIQEVLAVWAFDGEGDEITLRKAAAEIIIPFIAANMSYDKLGTLQQMSLAEISIKPIISTIEAGEYIIIKDYIITQEAIEKLQALQKNELKKSLWEKIGTVLYVTVLTIIMLYILVSFMPSNYRYRQFLYITLSGIIIYYLLFAGITSILFSRRITFFAFFIPIAFTTMMLTVVAGKQIGYLISAYIALLSFTIPYGNFSSFLFLLFLGLTGAVIITHTRKRIDMIKSFLYLVASGMGILIVLGLIGKYNLEEFYMYSIIIALNALTSSILFVMLLPIIENIFNLPTDFRLLELTTMNTKILKRMAVVARGTYSHSVAVADLAESACEVIGANSLLARVGAYYHDIGKIDQPEYFIENQTGDNKHDELKPSLSAAVIKSHVKVGIEKAKEIGLPQEVIDILAQHHGSDLISYFYIEAMNKNDKNSKISPEDFSYNGILPMTREAAVVMLADSVDAASRTIKQPTTPKIEKLVWKIIMDKINNKQLMNCHLSLSELEEIKTRFIVILSGRYHTRIEYPELPEVKKT
ncbi:MAG: HDIG domain-containing protein [Spirochaetia bacterium]|nr:HDIG domain-containing protein [Spirochaetia bacterium]